jgi:hypothetical protein
VIFNGDNNLLRGQREQRAQQQGDEQGFAGHGDVLAGKQPNEWDQMKLD